MGHSRRHQATAVLFLRHAYTGKWMLPGGEYDGVIDTDRRHTAAREFVEEAQSVPGARAAVEGARLLQRAVDAQMWFGPYGAPPYEPHMAFLLLNDGHVLPDMDALVAAFAPNRECAEARLVPLAGLDGNSKTAGTFDGGSDLQLRDRVGFLRVQAMRAIDLTGRGPRLEVPPGSSDGGSDGGGAGGDGNGAEVGDAPLEEAPGTRPATAAAGTATLDGRNGSGGDDSSGAAAAQRGVHAAAEERARRERRQRFAVPDDGARAALGVKAQREAYAEQLARHRADKRPRRQGLNLWGGRRRRGDIQWHAEQDGQHCTTQDRKVAGVAGADLNQPGARARFEAFATGRFHWMHASWDCFSWSPALSLPPGGTGFGDMGRAPLGPYRTPAEPKGLASLPLRTWARVDNSNTHLALTLRLAYDIDARGGSVSLENSPDCRDATSPWFIARDGFTSATQFPVWADPDMQRYIRHTGSKLITLAISAYDSPYRGYKTFCLNRKAQATPAAARMRAHAVNGPRDGPCVPMSGRAADGRSHGEIAAEYTEALARDLYGLHRDGADGDGEASSSSPKRGRVEAPPPADADAGTGPAGATARSPPSPAAPPQGGTATDSEPVQASTPPTSHTGGGARALRSVVWLVLVMAGGAAVGLLQGGEIARAEIEAPFSAAGRKLAMTTAAALLQREYGLAEAQAPLVMAGGFASRSPVDYVVAALADEPFAGAVVPLRDIGSSAVREFISLAVASLDQLVGRAPLEDLPLPPGAVLGFDIPRAVAVEPGRSDEGTRLFEERNVHDAAHIDAARRALDDEARRQLAAGDVDLAHYLTEVRDQVAHGTSADVPATVASMSEPTAEWMVYEPFVVKSPLRTPPIPPAAAQIRPAQVFSTIDELHNAPFLQRLQRWFDDTTAWLLAIARNDAHPPPRPPEFIAGQTEAFVPGARGCVWDVRRASEGIIEPLDFTAQQDSKWNTAWLRQQWAGYCDQEAVSHACDGADLKCELALQYVFSPHLLSLADDYGTCLADITALRTEGYYQWFSHFAFCPCRFNGQGLRPKGLGWRRIASGSCPYEPILDSDGVAARSINADSRRLAAAPQLSRARTRWRTALVMVVYLLLVFGRVAAWPDALGLRTRRRFRKERKPRVPNAMQDTTVMRAIGDRLGLGVYFFSDDFRHFFYQLRYAVRCLWYAGIYLVDPTTGLGLVIVELALAMGFTPASNIAQMICDAILYIFDNMMEAAETAAGTMEQSLLEIMAGRAARHGNPHARPWTSRGYTDDCLLIILGAVRFARAVAVWRMLLRTARIQGARCEKRQAGTAVLFLGVTLLATALAALVPEHKLSRALMGLANLLAGELAKEAATRLFGLLVHLSFLSVTGRATTAGMWRCLRHHRRDPILLYPEEEQKAERWVRRLRTSHAAPMDVALRRRQRERAPPPSAVSISGQSDAFVTRPTPEAGAGGYSHGQLWRVDIVGALVRAPISAIELMAFWLHLIFNAPAHRLADAIVHFVDNMNALLAMTRESAQAPFMQWLYDEIRQSPEFQAVAHKLRVGQRWGVWLALADAASRDYREVIDTIGARAHINMRWAPTPPRVHTALAQATAAFEQFERYATEAPSSSIRLPVAAAVEQHDERRAIPPARAQQRRARRGGGARAMLLVLSALLGLGGASPVRQSGGMLLLSLATAWSPVGAVSHTRVATHRTPRRAGIAVAAATATASLTLGSAAKRAPRRRNPMPALGVAAVLGTVAIASVVSRAPRRRPAPPLSAPVSPTTGPEAAVGRRQARLGAHYRSETAAQCLGDDGSMYALRPKDPAYWHELMCGVDEAIADGVNDNTSKGEHSAWTRYYLPYCARLRTTAWRGVQAAINPVREGAFICGFAMEVWRKMKPRRRADAAPRVDSVRNVVGHIRRRHERRGQQLVSTKMLAHVMKGMVRRRIADHGLALPVRAEPFTADENVRMKSVPPGTPVAGRQRDARFWAGWRLIDTYADQAGPRKSEIVGYEDIAFTRADVQFVLNGRVIPDPSPSDLNAMKSGRDRVHVKVNISKADFDGTKFGPSLVALLLNADNPMSFAAAVVDYELAYPLRGAARRTTPLFTTDGVTPWTGSLIDATLTAVMRATLTPAQRIRKTFHSKRVWVATGLSDLKSSDGEIQAMVRWSSVESLRIYARMNLDYQARKRDSLAHANVESLNATSTPDIGDGGGDDADGLEVLAHAFAAE